MSRRKQRLLGEMALDGQNNSGFENMDSSDYAIPFLQLLQSGSPQVKKGDQQIPGAEEGDFYNSVTQSVYKDFVYLIPCSYEKAYVEWVLRENKGGFVTKHSDPSILNKTELDHKNRQVLPNGNQVVVTAYHYCLLIKENGDIERAVLGLTSTQLKKSRKWNSQMMALSITYKGKKVKPPTYSHIYVCDSLVEQNDDGQWMGYNFSKPRPITSANIYMEAKRFHEDVNKNLVKIVPPAAQDERAAPEEETAF